MQFSLGRNAISDISVQAVFLIFITSMPLLRVFPKKHASLSGPSASAGLLVTAQLYGKQAEAFSTRC